MQILLQRLWFKNAKGVKEFEFIPNCKNAIISGDNGTGKTTIFDAFLWCLFDMDSTGRKGADAIKTTKKTEYVHFLEHEVIIEFIIDGKRMEIRKLLKEKWITPKQQSEQKMDGNITTFWINGDSKLVSEYNAEINKLLPVTNIAPDLLLKILTDPLYFSTKLEWRDRLNILVNLVGGVTEEDICNGDPDLIAMCQAKEDRTIEEYKKRINDQIKVINEQIANIPPKISELSSLTKESPEWNTINDKIENQRQAIRLLDAKLAKVSELNKPAIEAQAELNRLEETRAKLLKGMADAANDSIKTLDMKFVEVKKDVDQNEQFIITLHRIIDVNTKAIEEYEQQLSALRKSWKEYEELRIEKFNSAFIPPDLSGETCSACGQKLPESSVAEIMEAAKTSFEKNKVETLSNYESTQKIISIKASAITPEVQKLQIAKDSAIEELKQAEKDLIANTELLESVEDLRKMAIISKPEDFIGASEIQEIDKLIDDARARANKTYEENANEIFTQKSFATTELDRLNHVAWDKENAFEIKLRIAELEHDLKEITVKKAALQGQLFLCDKFVIERTKAIEGKINSRFSQVGFKLFKEQVNGGIDETCEAVVGETTFSKANTAAQVNAGLDIINTLSAFYNVYAPVFIDRLESNLHLYPVVSQHFTLLAIDKPIEVKILN